jgi:hypothetical protein
MHQRNNNSSQHSPPRKLANTMSDREAEMNGDGAVLGEFNISEDLVSSPTHKQASTKAVDFDGLLQETPLKLH